MMTHVPLRNSKSCTPSSILRHRCCGHSNRSRNNSRRRSKNSIMILLLFLWIVDVVVVVVVQSSPSVGDDYTALILLVQFPDHQNRLLPEREYFQNLCDTHIIDYLSQQSYGQYTLKACHVQDWAMTNASEAYFAGGVANRKSPEEAGAFAVAVLDRMDASGRIDWNIYDVNGDGALDAVILLHSGWASERGNGDCEGGRNPQDRLQSMAGPDSKGAWRSSTNTSIYLSGYGIASAYDNVCSTKPALMGVWAHEFFHLFSTPDLYDPGKLNGGLGFFDIMSNPEGAIPGFVPGSASPYTKIRIGWVEPMEIRYDGVYTLRSFNLFPDCYIIHQGFGLNEYLLIENRYLIGYDKELPGTGGGLLIYHVDELQESFQTRPGWPGFDSNWPYDHYAVALLQQDGNYDLEKGYNSGDNGDYYTHASRGLLPGYANFFPNTDSYQFGQITSTNISIIDISEPGEVVTFRVTGLGPDPATIITGDSSSTMSPTITPPTTLVEVTSQGNCAWMSRTISIIVMILIMVVP